MLLCVRLWSCEDGIGEPWKEDGKGPSIEAVHKQWQSVQSSEERSQL